MSHTVDNDAPFTVPSVEWLRAALCGWHDAESGREPGEAFPCPTCTAQAEYVAEQADLARPIPPDVGAP
jgi:hypothetical protein